MTHPPEPSSPPKGTSTRTWLLIALGFVVTLLVGLAIGLRLRPGATAVSVAVTPDEAGNQTTIETSPQTDSSPPAADSDFMAFLLSDARHFEGDADAPVTLIEFSDFK